MFLVAAQFCLTEGRSHGNAKINALIKRLEKAQDIRLKGEALANVRVSDGGCGDGCEAALAVACTSMLTSKVLSSPYFLFIACIETIEVPPAFMECVKGEMEADDWILNCDLG